MKSKSIKIDYTLFWQMYNELRSAECTLWDLKSEYDPESNNGMDIHQTYDDISLVLNKVKPVIEKIKDKEYEKC
jgi:hypothetical protein